MEVRTAGDDDWSGIWPIWHAVVARGDTYLWDPGTTEEDARRAWMLPPPAEVVVAVDRAGQVAGTAVFKPNQPGLGAHVANASFMVDPARRGEGIGRTLGDAVLERAREAGYEAMQFNAVVASNTVAIRLWESLGFAVVGTIPGAFRHVELGPTDLLVMHRRLL